MTAKPHLHGTANSAQIIPSSLIAFTSFALSLSTQLGKVQARRLALSADNRTILLSSSKLTSRIKSVKKLFKSSTSAGGDGNATGGSPGSSGGEMGTSGVRKVDVGLLDHVQRGQHTSKFRLAR